MSETDSEFMARVLQKALDAWKSRALVAEAEIDRQNNRYSEMSAEADRLCKMVTAFREQDDAIRAEFGGKRDGRPTIECLRKAFNAKWSAEDTLFQATLDMKTEELRAEVARLTAENEKLRAALQEAFEVYAGSEGFIPETAAEGYQQQVIKQMVDCINVGLTALQDKSDE